jgi:hypothetical protein
MCSQGLNTNTHTYSPLNYEILTITLLDKNKKIIRNIRGMGYKKRVVIFFGFLINNKKQKKDRKKRVVLNYGNDQSS